MRATIAVAFCLLATVATAASACKQLKDWDQCGGKSNCVGTGCADQKWLDSCCPSGSTCVRNNEWYYNCQPGTQPQQQPQQQQQQQQQQTSVTGSATPANPSQPASPTKPTPAVVAKKVGGEYDYGQVLGLSMMFYEAQRSGKLPANNRIKWRGDSGLNDRAPDGQDVTGGWYDAGDNVKFNLPMAWSAAVLAWGVLEFEKGYKAAGQYDYALGNIKWASDYFIKCIGDGNSIVVQVGNGNQDHANWDRPEDVKGPVPVYLVTPQAPGSDVVGAMAAALAAASAVFKTVDPKYSQQLLLAAQKGYEFAAKYPGSYSKSVADAASFYPSSNYMDDVAYAACWLYVRTGDVKYKAAALDWYTKHYTQEDGKGVWNNFDWDSNSWGAVVMLTRIFPDNQLVRARINEFIKAWTQGVDGVTFTPNGLTFSGPWGSLRHTGNALFLMKVYANGAPASALPATTKRAIDCSVRQQLGYILGDTGRSFVVGYGVNAPQRPHHRGSSCPDIGTECTWDYFNSPNPNPHTLFGALVGGPAGDDSYADARNDFMKNEVATDYNAGFSGALAAAEQGLLCKASRKVAF